MEENGKEKQVLEAEQAILLLAKEKNRATDIIAIAEKLSKTAEDQVIAIKNSKEQLDMLAEALTKSTDASRTALASLYKEAANSLNDTVLKLDSAKNDIHSTQLNIENKMKDLENDYLKMNININDSSQKINDRIGELNTSVIKINGAISEIAAISRKNHAITLVAAISAIAAAVLAMAAMIV